MTRAERIEAAAMDLRKKAQATAYAAMFGEILALSEALALPPDPVPRRLTAYDIGMARDHGAMADSFCADIWMEAEADFLNARIFGETK